MRREDAKIFFLSSAPKVRMSFAFRPKRCWRNLRNALTRAKTTSPKRSEEGRVCLPPPDHTLHSPPPQLMPASGCRRKKISGNLRRCPPNRMRQISTLSPSSLHLTTAPSTEIASSLRHFLQTASRAAICIPPRSSPATNSTAVSFFGNSKTNINMTKKEIFPSEDWKQLKLALVLGRLTAKNDPKDLEDVEIIALSTEKFLKFFPEDQKSLFDYYGQSPYPEEWMPSWKAFFDLLVRHPDHRVRGELAKAKFLTYKQVRTLSEDVSILPCVFFRRATVSALLPMTLL